MTSRPFSPWRLVRRLSAILSILILAVVYTALPILAALYELGDERGPKIYPESLHRQLYGYGRSLVDLDWRPEREHRTPRPLFYGME